MTQLYINTPKSVVSTLPIYRFEGKIVVVQSKRETAAAIHMLSKEKIVGIDTETRPSFRKGTTNKVALLQIATKDICFLFRINMTGLTNDIIGLLSNPDIKKVGLSLKDDLHSLNKRAKLQPENWTDLQNEIVKLGIKDLSLQKIFANLFGQRISKGAQLSNWENDVLTPAQKTYAATDAQSCLLLYERINELLQNSDFELIEESI